MALAIALILTVALMIAMGLIFTFISLKLSFDYYLFGKNFIRAYGLSPNPINERGF
jgi:hypothetical protein